VINKILNKENFKTGQFQERILSGIEGINVSLSQTFPKLEDQRTLPNTFYEVSLTKHQTHTRILHGKKYRPISLMTKDAKILNNI
jgi:hypothetical protein